MNCLWRNKLSPSPRSRRGVHIVKVCPVDNIYLLCYTATCLSSIAGAGHSSPFPSHQGVHTRWFGRALDWQSRGQRFDPAYLHHRETGKARFDESQNELFPFPAIRQIDISQTASFVLSSNGRSVWNARFFMLRYQEIDYKIMPQPIIMWSRSLRRGCPERNTLFFIFRNRRTAANGRCTGFRLLLRR